MIEISDSTLKFDLGVKAPLYARAGIVEYWVVDVLAKQLTVHCDPRAGRYRGVIQFSSNEVVSPLAAPTASFCLDLL